MGTILDIIVVIIIGAFILSGIRSGFIRSIVGLVALVAGFFGAAYLAGTYAEPVSEAVFQPIVSGWVEEAYETALSDTGLEDAVQSGMDLAQGVQDVVRRVMEEMNVPFFFFGAAEEAVSQAIESAEQTKQAITASITKAISDKIAYFAIFVGALCLIIFLIHMIGRLLNAVARLPILRAINRIGGALVGLCWGYLFTMFLVWSILFFIPKSGEAGGILSQSNGEDSVIAGHFIGGYEKTVFTKS